jgi:hypothetical protein
MPFQRTSVLAMAVIQTISGRSSGRAAGSTVMVRST